MLTPVGHQHFLIFPYVVVYCSDIADDYIRHGEMRFYVFLTFIFLIISPHFT